MHKWALFTLNSSRNIKWPGVNYA